MHTIPKISFARFFKHQRPDVLTKQFSPKPASDGTGKLVRGLEELGRLAINATEKSSLWIGFGTG